MGGWDAIRARKLGHPAGPRARDRCLWCGQDPAPRVFYCSDRCSEESRADNSRLMIDDRRKKQSEGPGEAPAELW